MITKEVEMLYQTLWYQVNAIKLIFDKKKKKKNLEPPNNYTQNTLPPTL